MRVGCLEWLGALIGRVRAPDSGMRVRLAPRAACCADLPGTPVPHSGGEVDLKSYASLPGSVEDEVRRSDVLGSNTHGFVQGDLVR